MEANVKDLMSKMRANYESAKNTAKAYSGEKLPAGRYEMRLTKVKLVATGEKLSIQRNFVVLAGEHKGFQATDFMQLTHEVGLSFAMQFVIKMGYEIPESPEDWADMVEALTTDQAEVIASCVHSGDFVNIRVEELIGLGVADITESMEVEEDETLDPEVEEVEVEEVVEEAPAPAPVDKKKKAEPKASALTIKELVKFANNLGIDEVDDSMELHEATAILETYSVDAGDLEAEDLAFIKKHKIDMLG